MLYKLEMNGKQLKKFMEWTAAFYNQYEEGDLTVSFNPNFYTYNYDMFAGVNYEIDISKPAGSRITNLRWPDGAIVNYDDVFTIAINSYQARSLLLSPVMIYEEEDLPALIEMDIRGDIGSIRELIGDYITDVKGGVITPVVDNNWKITGNNWDKTLHAKTVEEAAAGLITIPKSEDGLSINVKSITADDLK